MTITAIAPARQRSIPTRINFPTPTSPTRRCSDTDLVEATAFRALARQLISDTGIPWRVISRATGISATVISQLLKGVNGHEIRMIARRDAAALLSFNRRKVEDLKAAPAPCPAVRMMAWRLSLEGIEIEQLASFLAIRTFELRRLMAGEDIWCSQLSMLRAEAACQAWGIDPDALLTPTTRQWNR